MDLLKVTSCQAPNADFVCQAITDYLGHKLALPTTFINDVPWQSRARRFDSGDIQISWLCGLPYVQKADRLEVGLELLAAPVMAAPRYQGRPIYFSDVVVHRDSPFHTFANLRGTTWAYNEPNSQSGYNLTRYYLAMLGERVGYFKRVVRAGAHQVALAMVLEQQVDASAIDSTVLDLEVEQRPEIADQFRVIEVLGPSPVPPWVISTNVPRPLRREIQARLLQMHLDPFGQTILSAGQMARFVLVSDYDYDRIRCMLRQAEAVIW